jgi:hypothetical protein
MNVVGSRHAVLDTVDLQQGSHDAGTTFCVMEAVAYVAGEVWSDHPTCASPVLTTFMTAWNDGLSDTDRQRLKPYVTRLVGSRSTAAVEAKRSWMGCDWLVRTFTSTWLRRAGLEEPADTIAGLPELTELDLLEAAIPTIEHARTAACSQWTKAIGAMWTSSTSALGAAQRTDYGDDYAESYDAALAARPSMVEDDPSWLETVEHAALAAIRDTALAAGMVSGRGAAFGAALGGSFDIALDDALGPALAAVHTAIGTDEFDAALAGVRDAAMSAGRGAIPNPAYVSALGMTYDAALDSMFSVAYGPAYGAAFGVGDQAGIDVVRGAALGAARGALAPTVLALQSSSFELLDTMLAVRH